MLNSQYGGTQLFGESSAKQDSKILTLNVNTPPD